MIRNRGGGQAAHPDAPVEDAGALVTDGFGHPLAQRGEPAGLFDAMSTASPADDLVVAQRYGTPRHEAVVEGQRGLRGRARRDLLGDHELVARTDELTDGGPKRRLVGIGPPLSSPKITESVGSMRSTAENSQPSSRPAWVARARHASSGSSASMEATESPAWLSSSSSASHFSAGTSPTAHTVAAAASSSRSTETALVPSPLNTMRKSPTESCTASVAVSMIPERPNAS